MNRRRLRQIDRVKERQGDRDNGQESVAKEEVRVKENRVIFSYNCDDDYQDRDALQFLTRGMSEPAPCHLYERMEYHSS